MPLAFQWQARLVASICENVRSPQRQNPRIKDKPATNQGFICGTSVAESTKDERRKAEVCVLRHIQASHAWHILQLTRRDF